MLYKTMSTRVLNEIKQSGRGAFVVMNTASLDSDEYINACMATMEDEGFNTSIFLKPQVHIYNGHKDVILVFRNDKKINSEEQVNILKSWASKVGCCKTLDEYFQIMKEGDVRNIQSIKCKCSDFKNKKYYNSMIRIGVSKDKYRQLRAELIIDENRRVTVNLKDDKYIIADAISELYNAAYREYGILIDKAIITISGNTYKYDIIPDGLSVRLKLV